MSYLRALAIALVASSTAACGGCEEELITVNGPDASLIDVGFVPSLPDSGPADSGVFPDAAEPEGRVLTFDGTSPITMYYGATRDLRFVLRTTSGAAVASETVRFTVAGTGGSLNVTSFITDASGAGSVRFTAANTGGQAMITGSADRATPATVSIVVSEDPSAGLVVGLSSTTRIAAVSSEALIYVGATVPTCAQIVAAATPPAATLSAPFTALPDTRTFTGLASGSAVTVFATGRAASGAVIGRGCTEGARLAGGTNTRVDVTLAQLPSNLDGNYDLLLQLDLGVALPAPYDATVGLVTDLLSDPAGWAVYQTLRQADINLGTVFVTWTPAGSTTERLATFDEVRSNPMIFNVWRIGSSSLDAFLESQLGQTYLDVTNVGGDIARVVRQFEVGARYTLTSSGTADRLVVAESWQALVFTWRLNCPQGDLGCARRPIALTGANARLAPAQARYGATVAHAPLATPAPGETERFHLALDAHAVNLRYGAVILLVLNEIVFPNLPASVAGNSLTEVLGNIIGCTDVANSLASATGFPASFFLSVCNAGVSAAAIYIEDQLLALDTASNKTLTSGPTGGGELFLRDVDHDLSTELAESATMYAQWTDPNDPTASQDLTAPITGDGRRAAVGCGVDADCATGAICAAIPSYLKVRQLEKDCRRPVGAASSAAACTQHADCASGLCFDPGSGTRICYGACNGAGTCTAGTCTDDAASMDLDPVLTGLGDARTAACVP